MAFTASDLYLASGTGAVFNSWTPYVTKFDSSSYYNWEQDNLPLYDLEERTNLLWEKLGYPIADGFSGIPGIMFAVSADAPFAGESSGIIFKSVSSVINILPEVISIPIIIEVANYGDLGELTLKNIKFKDQGGLEIINRNFAKLYSYDADNNRTRLVGAGSISAIDGYDTLHAASCISISALVTSTTFGTAEPRYEGNNILYCSRVNGSFVTARPTSSLFNLRHDATVDAGGTFENTTSKVLKMLATGYDSTKDYTISSYDFLPYNGLAGTSNPATMRRTNHNAGNTTTPLTGAVYGNWFKKVTIKNCNGPLYIRNFAVDGGDGYAGALVHTTNNGFEISNSTVVLENALACRCTQTGFRFSNADITIARGIVAIRNYELSGVLDRTSYPTVGIKALNSNIVLSASPYVSGAEFMFHSTKNKIGVELFNSRLVGGQSRQITGHSSGITYIQTCYNNDVGIKLNGSYLEIPGRIDTYDNGLGLEAINSEIVANEATFEYNQTYGLKLDNSFFRYNQDLHKYTQADTLDPTGQIQFYRNTINLLSEKSTITYTEGEELPDKYGPFYVDSTFGVAVDLAGNKTSLPNMQIFNGSNFKVIHPYISNNQSTLATTLPIYGILASIKNNSRATFAGSKTHKNIFIGPPNYSQQVKLAAIATDNASIVEFQGPTIIAQTGIGVLAENQSVINFNPHKDVHGNLLVSAFSLSDPLNHTKIEIQSTRACVVANKNSIINMTDLGSFNTYWPVAQASAADYNYQNSYGIASAVSGGYMQFYPNGQDSNVISLSSGRYETATYNAGVFTSPGLANNYILTDWTLANANDDILNYSTGGMCLRAMNGSLVTVKNVHFPCGWENTSGNFYDASGGNCDLLRIWNIGADSEMDAAFISVSGGYPSLAGYNGPSSVYFSGSSPASAAPTWVPDTGVLSVLDYYGGSGATAPTNYGPFRIYVSVDGPAKFLNYYDDNGLYYNAAYQMLSQGYNPSGSLSAAPQVSGYYRDLTTSTFLTTSAAIDPGFRSRIRLDQSAADTFANAKNGATAKSGRVPFCSIYRSGIDDGGEGFSTSATGYGLGLLSVNIFDLSRNN